MIFRSEGPNPCYGIEKVMCIALVVEPIRAMDRDCIGETTESAGRQVFVLGKRGQKALTGRVAIIVVHGIGEQIPMATLAGFVDGVFGKDLSLVRAGKPHPDTGELHRQANAAWYKPDPRTRNFDLRLITTESYETAAGHQKRADFFEFYWAHRVTGTGWEQVKAWLFGLMLRNPKTKVPPPLWRAWGAMWVLLVLYLAVSGGLAWWLRDKPLLAALAVAIVSGPAALFYKVMNNWVGDIVRYVDPSPRNIKTRQAIREDGVRLLETLLGVGEDGSFSGSHYDRVVLVGHSLGTIVGYDILNHTFARLNLVFDRARLAQTDQRRLAELEALVRKAWESGAPLDLLRYRELQQAARKELNAAGNPWIVSDFITLGSPLTHAEFLMARDREHLAELQATRVYPTSPPQFEFHRTAPHWHFSYDADKGLAGKEGPSLKGKRVPHHAATFAFTRWTNIYSELRGISGGDIVSGRLCRVFGLAPRQEGKGKLSGIEDIAVLPTEDGTPEDTKRRRFTHVQYWDMNVAATSQSGEVPRHVQRLREALDLKETS